MKSFLLFVTVILFACTFSSCNTKTEKRLVGIDPEDISSDTTLEGERSIYSKQDKLRYTVEYKKGQANGRVREFYEDGKMYMEAEYKDSQRNGKCTYFFKNGSPFSDCIFKDGLKEGLETKYYEDGKVFSLNTFQKGKVQPGLIEYNKKGTEILDKLSIVVTEVDHLSLDGKFFLQISLSNPDKDANYYASTPGETGPRQKLKKSGKKGILEIPVNSGFVMKKLIFDAEYKTARGNDRRLQRTYNLAIDG